MTNTVCNRTGEFISAMVATKREGVVLAIGEQPLHYQKEIMSALDPLSRLIVSLNPSIAKLPVEKNLESDLRVAVHRQDIQEFLDDIKQHRFKMIMLGEESINDSLIAKCINILEQGGMMLVLRSLPASAPPNLVPCEQCWSVSLDFCDLIVKSDRQKKPVRRGGRKGRQGTQI